MANSPNKVFVIERRIPISLSMEECLRIVKKLAKTNPDVIQIILENRDNIQNICPFPNDCLDFPCLTLHCNGDVCDNGRVYKQS